MAVHSSTVSLLNVPEFFSCEEDHKGKIDIHCRICSGQDRIYLRPRPADRPQRDIDEFISRFVDEHADICYVPTVCRNLEDYDRPVVYRPAPWEQERPLMLDSPFDAKIEEIKTIRQDALYRMDKILMDQCDKMLENEGVEQDPYGASDVPDQSSIYFP
jgi:hypothetical protein